MAPAFQILRWALALGLGLTFKATHAFRSQGSREPKGDAGLGPRAAGWGLCPGVWLLVRRWGLWSEGEAWPVVRGWGLGSGSHVQWPASLYKASVSIDDFLSSLDSYEIAFPTRVDHNGALLAFSPPAPRRQRRGAGASTESHLFYKVAAPSTHFVLNLTRSPRLLAGYISVEYWTRKGLAWQRAAKPHCLYSGHLQGHAGSSQVAVSTCGGLVSCGRMGRMGGQVGGGSEKYGARVRNHSTAGRVFTLCTWLTCIGSRLPM